MASALSARAFMPDAMLTGAESWTFVEGSDKFGSCWTFKNGTIDNVAYIFASCDAGIANVPVKGGAWNVIGPGGWGSAGYLTQSDNNGGNTVLGGCLGGHVYFGTTINTTAANWTSFPDRPCTMLALNPNNKDHFIYTKPPMTYQSIDGGKTYESLNHSGIFHCGIDRRGNLYTAAMEGAFVSRDCGPGPNMKRPCHWLGTYDNRTQRRTGHSMIRGAHDYQRISMDFAGTVAFPSDQGLFIMPQDGTLELYKANGNMSNNIALKAAISKGDGPGKRYIVTAVWDWAPLASWDSGDHWPSWQTPADGTSGSCIGEGGGAYAMGASNHMLLMHHHNVLASAEGGKNLSRFITPHGSTIFGPTYQTKAGSLSEPNGEVYAPLIMGPLPWDQHMDKVATCQGAEQGMDLGVHTNGSCLSAVDLGVTLGWYPGTNYAVWRGDSDKHCRLCHISDKNSSHWKYTAQKGAISYSKVVAKSQASYEAMMEFDANGDGMLDEHDLKASMINAEKLDEGEDTNEGDKDGETGASLVYVLKNSKFGQGLNFSYVAIPAYVGSGFLAGPMNANGKSVLYGVAPGCISRSYDQGETWAGCWNPPPPPPPTDALGFHKSPGALRAGNDMNKANMTEKAAEVWCHAHTNCSGFTTLSAKPTAVKEIYFKLLPSGANSDSVWVSYAKPTPPPPGPPIPHGNATGLTGSFDGLVIKNETFMIVTRGGEVPLRTTDGGKNWEPMNSCAPVATFGHDMLYSWSGKTLIMMGSGGTQTADHPHAAFVWASKDDGETWTDETGDIVTMGPGAANWYEGDFYINSMGQGIMVKTLE